MYTGVFEFQKITNDDSLVDCDQYCKLVTLFSNILVITLTLSAYM